MNSIKKDLNETKVSFSTRVHDLERENSKLEISLRSSQKLAEMQMSENKKLLEKKALHNKENSILKKEISLLEEAHSKSIHKNKSLMSKTCRLEKIVYGSKKSNNIKSPAK